MSASVASPVSVVEPSEADVHASELPIISKPAGPLQG